MGHFTRTALPANPLKLADAPYPALCQVQPDLWVLLGDFSYTRDNGTMYTAPAGMTTDLASIPRIAWSILPPFGKYTGAAVIHDYLYRAKPCTRDVADLILAEAMDAEGVEHLTRELIYKAVAAAGQDAWATDRGGLPSS